MPHLVGERGQAPDLGLLARRDSTEALFVLRARIEVLRVRALVLAQVALVEVQHLGDRLVEQFEVVAHDEQRAAVRAQEAHQPFLGVDVEVVGGLVEDEVVGAAEQDACQLDASPLSTGEGGERELRAIGREAEAGEDAVHVGLGAVAARVAERLLRVREAADRAVVGVVLHVAAQLLDLLALRVEPSCGEHVRHGDVLRAGALGTWVLRQEAERARDRDAAARGGRSPPSVRRSVVLPAPLRPTSPTLSPAYTENDASSTSTRSATSIVSSCARITAFDGTGSQRRHGPIFRGIATGRPS